MKKITTLFLSMLLLVVLVNVSSAQPIKPKPKYGYFQISLDGGISNPIGAFTDNNKLGPTFGGEIGYRITREVALEIGGAYSSFGSVSPLIGKTGILAITAGPKYYFVNPSIKSQLYLDASAGAYIVTSGDQTDASGVVTAGLSKTNIGIGIGLGGTVQVADNMELFIRGKYHVIFSGKDETTGVSADSKAYVNAIGGLTFYLR